MKYPTTRFVFDRKKTASKEKDALIQVEVLHERRKKYISTGVKVYKDQWSEKAHVINRNDMLSLNERIQTMKTGIDRYINSLIVNEVEFSWEAFESYLRRSEAVNQTFIDYIADRIEERNDITLSTKKNHRKLLSIMEEFGGITTFAQLTRPNISRFYDWLLGRDIIKISRDGTEIKTKMAQQTVSGYMKTLRTYIHDAIIMEKLDKDPSVGIKVKRGETMDSKWLTEEEVKRLEETEMPNGSLTRVRDLFIYCCYTGLAFADLMDFDPSKIEREDDYMIMHGRRAKTGQEYFVLILPKAQEILEKYNYKLPKYSNQQYNHRLKDVAKVANINKPLASHFARHTAGMLLLNNGVRLEVVAKVLGHSSVKITEKVYASVLKKTVAMEMSKMLDK